jgi:DNA-binding NarL/FixJ family response regulator
MTTNMRNGSATRQGPRRAQVGLISYLAKLGLGDADLTEVMSLLHTAQGPQPDYADAPSAAALDVPVQPNRPQAVDGPGMATQKTIKIYLAEEQQILKEAYESFFKLQPGLDLLGSSDDISAESIVAAAHSLDPQVMVLGVKSVQAATVERLEKLREAQADLPIVLLFAVYDAQGIKALREFSRDAAVGCAYLLKHTVDTMEQLSQVISAVAQGRIIVDPMVMEGLIRTGDGQKGFLTDLSPRELEVLSWMAKGYRNDTIAQVLSRDVKTVERHINNIYGKLQDADEFDEGADRRVRAALMYLRATGVLPAEQLPEA